MGDEKLVIFVGTRAVFSQGRDSETSQILVNLCSELNHGNLTAEDVCKQ